MKRQTSWEEEVILMTCAVGIDKLLLLAETLNCKQARELEVIVKSSWPAITCWIEDINTSLYPRLEPEKKKLYQRCLLHVCSIIAACPDINLASDIPAMPPISSVLAELWIKGEFSWIGERMGVCYAFFITS